MKLVFFGNAAFGVPTLEALRRAGYDIVVVTNPPKPAGRGRRLRPTPVETAARRLNLPVIYAPENLRDPAWLDQLRQVNAPLGVVVAFRILPEAVIRLFPKQIINLHPSLLPKFRGPAPIPWAIMAGETETGVTTILITPDVDAGPILLQEKEPIYPTDTGGSLHDRLAAKGAELTVRSVDLWLQDRITPRPQEGIPTRAPKLTRENTRIHWTEPAARIERQVRALYPAPLAWTRESESSKRFKITRARPLSSLTLPPGEIQISDGRLLVGTGSEALEILRLIPEGKKEMDAAAFLRGWRLPLHKFI